MLKCCVFELIAHDRQLASLLEIQEPGRDRLAPLQHALMRPGVRPPEPVLRFPAPVQDDHAEEVVEAATVDADDNDLTPPKHERRG